MITNFKAVQLSKARLTELEKQIVIDDEGDRESHFYVAKDLQRNDLAYGIDSNKVFRAAVKILVDREAKKEITPVSAGFENSEISFLMRD